jgi:monofunctional biosynthetic peptidoglycan transglycosylase
MILNLNLKILVLRSVNVHPRGISYFFCKKTALLTSGVSGLFITLSFIFVIIYKYINPPVTLLMIIRHFEAHREDTTLQKEWKDIEKISPTALLAVIASEDQKFFDHSGFDFEEIDKALDDNNKSKRLRGASTISQQTAKNVFLWPARTWLRKGLETYFTVLIELLWDKRRILEIYMNVCETGKGMYGIEAASKIYFQKPSSRLSISEAALIAAALPNPLTRNPVRPSSFMIKKKNWIIKQMNNLGGSAFIKKNLPYVSFTY